MRKQEYFAIFIVAALCIAGANSALAERPKQVEIVNSPLPVVVQNPQSDVSVSGTVSVSGPVDVSGSDVNATISGMPDVNVANTPDVNVANVPDVYVTNDETAPIPVTMQNGAQMTHMSVYVTEHVTLEATAFITGSRFFRYDRTTNRTIGNEFVVPEGKAFVLTDIYLTQGGYMTQTPNSGPSVVLVFSQ